ncbi:nucleotide exchange factor GrpE [Leeuwenhoekiella sp. NPDC079379]|uniref:nucleotide exchange factor GrpE n=1 Tax=Leeuwenhoekiella sp. NPDC079379 TaxID=3364122 RepID=UPI0037C50683
MSSENREDIINDQEDLNVETNLEETEVSENELTAEDQITNLQVELDKEKDKFLRLFAEFENYKRRTSKERVEMFKTAGQEVLQAMLPVLDDFDRAEIEIKKAKEKNLQKGVELISNKLRETLKSKGLKEMEVSAGDVFDADIHEAITQIPAPKDSLKGKIVDVIEKGYELGDKIIRFPKVVTGK